MDQGPSDLDVQHVESGGRDDCPEELESAEPEEGDQVGTAPDGVRFEVRRLPPRLKDGIVFSTGRPTGRCYFLA
jgi:hypothetical protein